MYIGAVVRERGGGENNIINKYDVTGLLTAVCKVTLRSSRLGCLRWSGERGSLMHSTYIHIYHSTYMDRTWRAALCFACQWLMWGFESRLVQDYQRNIMFLPSQYWDIFSEIVSLGKAHLPSHGSIDSGVNEYLVGQRWQCVRLVPSAEIAASAVCSKKGSWNGTWMSKFSDQG